MGIEKKLLGGHSSHSTIQFVLGLTAQYTWLEDQHNTQRHKELQIEQATLVASNVGNDVATGARRHSCLHSQPINQQPHSEPITPTTRVPPVFVSHAQQQANKQPSKPWRTPTPAPRFEAAIRIAGGVRNRASAWGPGRGWFHVWVSNHNKDGPNITPHGHCRPANVPTVDDWGTSAGPGPSNKPRGANSPCFVFVFLFFFWLNGWRIPETRETGNSDRRDVSSSRT